MVHVTYKHSGVTAADAVAVTDLSPALILAALSLQSCLELKNPCPALHPLVPAYSSCFLEQSLPQVPNSSAQ